MNQAEKSGANAPALAGAAAGRPGQAQAQNQARELKQLARGDSSVSGDDGIFDRAKSVQSIASAAKVGEYVQYTVPSVTLPRQRSAILPIITENVEVERVSIYNAAVHPRNPLNGWDIGSGPTEAMCKNLTLRLKRPGMKWDAVHAGTMMNLIALYEIGQAPAYHRHRAMPLAA